MDDNLSYPTWVMQAKNKKFSTNDQIIRDALRIKIQDDHKDDPAMIIEELGINHGSVRADIAAVNGVMHCYEIKSDRDTLLRLPGQIKAYNEVFDRVTLVVGFSHVFEALEIIPDWWGVVVAKQSQEGTVLFSEIRQTMPNNGRSGQSIARLLWRGEALAILEELDQARGFRSKPRNVIYEKLADSMEVNILADRVKQVLFVRNAWTAPLQQA